MHPNSTYARITAAARILPAVVLIIMAAFDVAPAAKPDKKPQETVLVAVLRDPANPSPTSPVWAPSSLDPPELAVTVGKGPAKYHFLFPNPAAGALSRAAIVTSTGVLLNDDIGCWVYLDKKGRVSELRVRARDVSGPEGLLHVSSLIEFDPPVDPDVHTDGNGVFTLEVGVDNLPIWNTLAHYMPKDESGFEMAGTISLGVIQYVPSP